MAFLKSRCGFLVLAVAAVIPAGRADAGYIITDLGSNGDGGSYGQAINEYGDVAGFSTGSGLNSHAFIYRGGLMTDLDTLAGRTSRPFGINASGQVVGYYYSSEDGYIVHAFLYSEGVMTDLGSAIGATSSDATAINASGQVVGSDSTGGTINEQAFLYSEGKTTLLGTLGGSRSAAQDVNDAGQVVGDSHTDGNASRHAFLYSGNQMIDLGALVGGDDSSATGINNVGQVVGNVSSPATRRYDQAFIYDHRDESVVFFKPHFGTDVRAEDINDAGQVVGFSGNRPFLYSGGVITDLNDLLPDDSGWLLDRAYGINNNGQITGYGHHNGQARAFLLTPESPSPVPEPTSLALLGTGAVGLLLGAGRRRKMFAEQVV